MSSKRKEPEPKSEQKQEVKESKHRFTLNDYGVQVKTIIEATNIIKQAVNEMPDCNVKKSYQTTVKNIEKKNFIVSKGQGENLISAEDKEILRKIRAGEVEITPIQR